MNEKPLPSPAQRTDDRDAAPSDAAAAGEPRAPEPPATPQQALPVTFTHVSKDLPVVADTAPRCDVCDAPLHGDESDDEETAFAGHGLYVWVRGGKTVYEEPPLCAACSTAIGMSALARWDSEEEEG